MSMDFAEYIMRLEVDVNHKQFARVLAIKQSVSSSILTATARVRAGLLRPTNDDGLAAVLAEISRNDDSPMEDEEIDERGELVAAEGGEDESYDQEVAALFD